MKLPVVLEEESVVIVVQVNLVSFGCQAAGGSHSEKAGVEWSESSEVIECSKELKVQNLRLDAIRLRPQEVPTKLEIVLSHQLVSLCGKRCEFLVQRCARRVIAERERTQVSEQSAGVVVAEHLEGCADARLWMRRACLSGVAAITAAQSHDPRIAGIAKQHRIAERQQQVSCASVVSS